ncbi:hypothetical protein [Longimicrobium terrae]|uniref:Uncharacterized protein n=1 Tax=Longimicrobium terrae TaxID=1639882 RepID=A0A841H1Z7_9BACT|nr:hypothetical protein [Longimicrobium terrae]MBB4637633.1 hypothetical protein [Longimicrobium terrae]MBB6072030.1 hypothetical protein [Longimicrobium terrae]
MHGPSRTAALAVVAIATLATAADASAQRRRASNEPAASCLQTPQATQPRTEHAPPADQRGYDVVLDVPALCVDAITLGVRNLDVHLALDAQVANLVQISAGADVRIASVDLGLYGVQAQALLLVDLDNVYQVVDRTMTFVDNNPQIVAALTNTVNNAVGTVGQVGNTLLQPGGVASQAVGVVGQTLDNTTRPGGLLTQTVNTLGQTVNTLGQTVNTIVTPTGQILEQTLDTAGRVVGSNAIGDVLRLPVISETAGTAGGLVRQVRDTAGRTIEVTLNQAGQVTGTRVLGQATGAVRP